MPGTKIPAGSGGGGGGSTTPANVEDFALTTSTADVPDSKIPSTITRDSEVEDFAKTASTATVSVAKIPGLVASKITSGMFALARIPVLTLAKLPAVASLLPSSLGTAGQVLQVNSGATAIEFAAAASGGFSPRLLGTALFTGTTPIVLLADFFDTTDYNANSFYLLTSERGSVVAQGAMLNTNSADVYNTVLFVGNVFYVRRRARYEAPNYIYSTVLEGAMHSASSNLRVNVSIYKLN